VRLLRRSSIETESVRLECGMLPGNPLLAEAFPRSHGWQQLAAQGTFFRLMKCSPVQALQTTDSYSLSGVSSPPSSQCWTFISVLGQVNSRVGIPPYRRAKVVRHDLRQLLNAPPAARALSGRPGRLGAHCGSVTNSKTDSLKRIFARWHKACLDHH